MNKQLISIAITSALLAGTAQYAHADDRSPSDTNHKQFIGTGIGATAGAILAGPAGLIIGGIIGNLAGKNDAMDDNTTARSNIDDVSHEETASNPVSASQPEDAAVEAIIVARTGEIDSIISTDKADHLSELKHALVDNFQLDILFLSGSTTIEDFYKPRLLAVTKLVQHMPEAAIYLEGYSDRRGNRDDNMALSTERLESVRDELIQAGIDANRIHTNAFGEQQFVSKPGELEAYTFDRRVVIRLQHPAAVSKSPVALSEAGQHVPQ